jgi:3-oxoacyl-[acyl-carrier-protein] synthase-3
MNGFSQFPAAVMMADALIRAGRARTILLSFGDNWTRYVNYDTPQAVSASDGAAAAVMALSDDPQAFRMVDQVCDVDTSYYGTMKMSGQEIHGAEAPPGVSLEDDAAYTHPFFQIDKAGQEGFREFGVQRAPEAVRRLLRIHHRDPAEVCLISHQASSVLMDHWRDVIRPGHYVNTLKTYANLVQTSVPFNLSWGLKHDPGFYQDWLATLCVGPDMHASAMLMRRG